MTNQIDHIVEHFFRKKTLDEVSVYELERFIATHPYFAAGHFLMARKAQFSEPGTVQQKIATAALYYPNPLWLQWLLEQDKNGNPEITAYDHVTAESRDAIKEPVAEVNTPVADTPDPVVDEITHPYIEKNIFQSATETNVDSSINSNQSQEDSYAEQEVHESFTTSPAAVPDENDNQIEAETFVVDEQDAADVQEAAETIADSNQFESSSADAANESSIELEIPEDGNAVERHQNINTEIQDGNEDTDPEPDEDQPLLTDEESKASIQKALGEISLIPTKADDEKSDFTFEPYHTIDYFASQGIKLQQSDLSKDKFGKQLKSFTEWLRSMKRLPQAPAETNIDEATQQSIQRIAEHSFEEKDIVTETMAEVWIKQGNKEKAIDTLHRLSLLNPSKSHYFAAKIEQLKVS